MNRLTQSVLTAGLTLLTLSPALVNAAPSEALQACKTEVSARYTIDGQAPLVKLAGTKGSGKAQKLRMRVSLAGGSPFNALCKFDRSAGMVVTVTSVRDADLFVADAN